MVCHVESFIEATLKGPVIVCVTALDCLYSHCALFLGVICAQLNRGRKLLS